MFFFMGKQKNKLLFIIKVSESINDCCLTPHEQLFSYIMLGHHNNSPRVDLFLHSDTLS